MCKVHFFPTKQSASKYPGLKEVGFQMALRRPYHPMPQSAHLQSLRKNKLVSPKADAEEEISKGRGRKLIGHSVRDLPPPTQKRLKGTRKVVGFFSRNTCVYFTLLRHLQICLFNGTRWRNASRTRKLITSL